MSTINGSVLSLVDWAKRLDPDGRVSAVGELLSQTNEILTDMVFKEGNLPTGERVTVRTGLPASTWRLLNQGVAPTKSTTAQIVEQIGMLEARGQVDKDIAELAADLAAFRLSEATPHMESMNQEMASTMFYGNSGLAQEEFTGLAPRYSQLTGVANSTNVIAGGSVDTDNSSIWLIVWGPQTVYGIFPKGSKAGLIHEDLGLNDAFDASGNRYRAYLDWWQWKNGIAVKDWRYAVRICNIDVSALVAESGATDLINKMSKAVHKIPFLTMGKPVFYMNRTVFSMLDIQRRSDVLAGGGLKYENVDGVATSTFRGIPIRKVDALLETESLVA